MVGSGGNGIKMDKSGLKWMKVDESCWKLMKEYESGRKWVKMDESSWKGMKADDMDESWWKWMKANENGLTKKVQTLGDPPHFKI